MDRPKQLCQSQGLFPPQSSSIDFTAETNGADWQEEVYQKIKQMKEAYYPELSEMYQKIASKLQQHDSLPQQPKSEQLEKLKMFKTMLERLLTVLQFSKNSISPGLKEKLALYEKQIINFINTNRPRRPVSSLDNAPKPDMQSAHAHVLQQPKVEQQESNESETMDSSGRDWQEELYQKIKLMKQTYLPELSEMLQKIVDKLQKHDSLPQQPSSDQLEKLKMFKTMLERLITVLQLSKNNVSPDLKEKLDSYDKQIINFINTNRPRNYPVSSVLNPPPELHLLQQPKEEQHWSTSTLISTQGYESQPYLSQTQHLPLQMQQCSSLQQQSHLLPQDMQLLYTMRQNQSYQSQRELLGTSSNSPAQTGHTYWQEEAYQKIKVMKQLYFPKLSDMYWKAVIKLQQEDSYVQQLTPDQHVNLNMLKNILERVIPVLHFSKADISVGFMDTLVSLEQYILTLVNTINPDIM